MPMIFEAEPEREINGYSLFTDSRYTTAAAYLKGLHYSDKPTALMPKDAIYLKAAWRFYSCLSVDDQNVIDSFSDNQLLNESLNIKQRNKRFNDLTRLFICQTENKSIQNLWFQPEQAEKERR